MNINNHLERMPIVHIEDDADDQNLIQLALTAASIANPVRFFSDGHQVLDYLRTTKEQPLVILCDVQMPGMNGFELRHHLEADESLRRKAVPFVFFSTWADQDLLNKAYQGTIQGYHRKGTTFNDLKEELALIIAYWKRCLHPKSV